MWKNFPNEESSLRTSTHHMYSIPCFNFFLKNWCWAREWCPLKLIVLVNEAPGPEGNILFISESWSRLSFLKYEFQSNIVCEKPVAHQKWGKCQKQTLLGHNSEATTHAVDLPPSYQTTPAQRWTKKVQLSDFHLAQLPPLSLCPGQLKMYPGQDFPYPKKYREGIHWKKLSACACNLIFRFSCVCCASCMSWTGNLECGVAKSDLNSTDG